MFQGRLSLVELEVQTTVEGSSKSGIALMLRLYTLHKSRG